MKTKDESVTGGLRGREARIRLRSLSATALAGAAMLGVATMGSVALAGSASATTPACSFANYGADGWTGLASGATVQTSTAGAGWFRGGDMLLLADYNNSASSDTISHAVTNLSADLPQIQFKAEWSQGVDGANTTIGAGSVLTVSYAGVVYAKLTTPGPNDSSQLAHTEVFNGATLGPSFPVGGAGLAEKTPWILTLHLPSGVPTNAAVSFTMSDKDGVVADNWSVGDVGGYSCAGTAGTPVVNLWVLGGMVGMGAVGATFLRRNKADALKRQHHVA